MLPRSQLNKNFEFSRFLSPESIILVNIKKSSTETINNIAKEFFVTTDIQLFSKQNLQNMFNYFLYNKHDYSLFDVISENNIITSAGYANFLTQRNLSYLTNL